MITEFVFNDLRSDLPFSRKSDRKGEGEREREREGEREGEREREKYVFSFTHEQYSICSQTQLDDIAHEQTIICRQLFLGHVVDSRPMKKKTNLHRMIIDFN